MRLFSVRGVVMQSHTNVKIVKHLVTRLLKCGQTVWEDSKCMQYDDEDTLAVSQHKNWLFPLYKLPHLQTFMHEKLKIHWN